MLRYFDLKFGDLDGKTTLPTTDGGFTRPLPPYPHRPTDSSYFRYSRKFALWLFASAYDCAQRRRDTLSSIRFAQAYRYHQNKKLSFGKGDIVNASDMYLAEQYLFGNSPFQSDPFFESEPL